MPVHCGKHQTDLILFQWTHDILRAWIFGTAEISSCNTIIHVLVILLGGHNRLTEVVRWYVVLGASGYRCSTPDPTQRGTPLCFHLIVLSLI